MTSKLKNIFFVICIVMAFTAQSNRPQEEKQNVPRPAARPQVQVHRAAPQAQSHRAAPQAVGRPSLPAQVRSARPSYQGRTTPRVYAVPASAPVWNNRLLGRQHHQHWQPRYNFYDNQYHFYPYVNIASLVELTPDCVAVLFDGQTFYYDQGTFYQQDPQGYLAIAPPLGIIINALPPQAREIEINGQIYYRYKGVCYVQVPGGFQVVGQVGTSLEES